MTRLPKQDCCQADNEILLLLADSQILAYNPEAMLPETRALVRAAPLLTHPPLRRGDSVKLVGLSDSLRIKQRTSIVTNATVALTIPAAEVPR